MKIKEFLLQKVNKNTLKKDSVQRAIKVTICCSFIFALIFQLVVCLFGSMSVYAVLPGDTVEIELLPSLPSSAIVDMDAVFESNGTTYYGIEINQGAIIYYTATDLPVSVYSGLSWSNDSYRILTITQMSPIAFTWISDNSTVLDSNYMTLKAGTYRFNDVPDLNDYGNVPLTIDLSFTVTSSLGFLAYCDSLTLTEFNVSYNIIETEPISEDIVVPIEFPAYSNEETSVGFGWDLLYFGSSGQYITIINDTYVENSSGLWFIANTNYNEVNAPSCPTLPELLRDYTGSFDSIVDMLNSTNYDQYEETIRFYEERAYNEGVSASFGENLLGATFNAPLTALNQWVLFETTGGIEITMGGVFSGLLALSILIILIKMFAGG